MTDAKKINISGIGKGIIFSIILTFVLILLIAALCYFFTIPDKLLSALVLASTCFSVLLGAIFVSRNACGSGLLHGLILSVGYILLLMLSELLSQGNLGIDMRSATSVAAAAASGMLGGILGINSKN